MEETKPLGFENLHIEDNKKEDKEEGLSTCVQCKKVLPEANMEIHPEFEKIKVFDIFFLSKICKIFVGNGEQRITSPPTQVLCRRRYVHYR